jgi:hypothetical protein
VNIGRNFLIFTRSLCIYFQGENMEYKAWFYSNCLMINIRYNRIYYSRVNCYMTLVCAGLVFCSLLGSLGRRHLLTFVSFRCHLQGQAAESVPVSACVRSCLRQYICHLCMRLSALAALSRCLGHNVHALGHAR